MAAHRTTTPREPRAVTPPNVVPIRAAKQSTDDIVREVEDRLYQGEDRVLRRLKSAADALERQHRARAQNLLGIGVAMDRSMLEAFIEIGQRMLGNRSRA